MKFGTHYLAEECQCHQTMFCANVQVGGNQVWTEEEKVKIYQISIDISYGWPIMTAEMSTVTSQLVDSLCTKLF